MPPALRDFTEFGHTARIWRNAAAPEHFSIPVWDLRWQMVFTLGIEALSALQDSPARPAVRSLLYRLGNIPIPASAPETWLGSDSTLLLKRLDEHSKAHGDHRVAEFASAVSELIRDPHIHPLWAAVQEHWARFAQPTCLVVGRTSIVPRLEPLAAKLPGPPIVIAPNEVDDMRFRFSAIIFGAPGAYPEWMKAMPRLTSYWVHFDWHNPPAEPEPFLFLGTRVGERLSVVRLGESTAPAVGRVRIAPHDEISDPIDWFAFQRHLTRTSRYQDQEDDLPVEVVAAALTDSRVVLLPVDGKTTVYDPDTGTVKGELGSRLRPGVFVILREGKDKDYFRQLVEQRFLPNAGEARRLLEHWKALLRKRIREIGLEAVAKRLRSMGVSAAQATIRAWGTTLIYGPGTREWFFALLEYLGVGDEEVHWAVLEAYRQAGSRAGHFIRSTLLEQIRASDPGIARHESTIRFTMAGFDEGGLVAHKLEAVHEERYEVVSKRVGAFISLGDL